MLCFRRGPGHAKVFMCVKADGKSDITIPPELMKEMCMAEVEK